MLGIAETLEIKREDVLKIAARHGARNLRVFGSVARGEDDNNSDLDLLVDMEPNRSLFDMGGHLMELQDVLDCKVDIVSEKGLSPLRITCKSSAKQREV